MKRSLLTLCLSIAVVSAFATNTPPPAPDPAPTSTSSSDSSAAAAAAAKAAAAAQAAAASKSVSGAAAVTGPSTSKSGAKATGGAGGAGGNSSAVSGPSSSGASSDSALSNIGNTNDQSKSSFKALAVSMPSPVFTPPLPMSGCPQANVEQSAVSVGWSFISHAQGSVNTDNCTAIIVYNAYLAQCKYESAQQVLNLLTAKVLPGFTPQTTVNVDLTTKECVELMKPIPAVNPTKAVDNYIYVEKHCVQPPTPATPPKKGTPKKVVKNACVK